MRGFTPVPALPLRYTGLGRGQRSVVEHDIVLNSNHSERSRELIIRTSVVIQVSYRFLSKSFFPGLLARRHHHYFSS